MRVELENSLRTFIDNKFNNFEQHNVRNIVSRVMVEQLPSYLDDNIKMKMIVDDHEVKLKQALVKQAEEILTKIADEDRYHVMQNEVRKCAEARVEKLLTDINLSHSKMLEHNNEEFTKYKKDVERKNDEAMQKFNNANSEINTLKEKLTEQRNINIVFGLGFFGLSFLTLYALVVNRLIFRCFLSWCVRYGNVIKTKNKSAMNCLKTKYIYSIT